MKTGEKYLVLQLGDLKIPFFPMVSKDGMAYFQAKMNIFVNEVKEKETKPEIKSVL